MSHFQPYSGGFEPSEHSSLGDVEPAAPGSNQAAYAAAAYWLQRAAAATSSYTERVILLGYSAKAAAAAALLDAVPGGKLAYGKEVAILSEAATHARSVPSAMSALIVLQGGVLKAREAAQQANPVYQGERAVSYLPWVLGGGLLLGALALSRAGSSGRANPSAWRELWDADVAGVGRDMREASADFESVRSARDLLPVARRGARRGLRRAFRADSARQILKLTGLVK